MTIFAMLAVATVLLALAGSDSENIANRDFIEYWASGRLLATGHNPYDRKAVMALQHEQGVRGTKFAFVRNPPWTLWWTAPLGLLSLKTAWVFWMTACMSALMLSIHLCWRMFGENDPAARSLFLLWTAGFAPVLACLMAGQIGFLLLLGLLLFLLWEQRRPFWAGFALILPLEKPHLIAPFLLVLLIWAFAERKWSVLAGIASAVAAATLPALLIDPQLFSHYRMGIAGEQIGGEFIPTVSGFLRAILFPWVFWVQFVPMITGMVCCTFFYLKAELWDWRVQGLGILMASVLVAPYGWLTDETVLLPVVLASGLRINGQKRNHWAIWALLAGSAILLLMTMGGVPITSGLYVWSVPLWLGWYWTAHRINQTSWPSQATLRRKMTFSKQAGAIPQPERR